MVGPSFIPQDFSTDSKCIQIADFLDWSLSHEELLLSCLTRVSNGILGQSLYPLEAVQWLSVIRSQFLQADLCTVESVSQLETIMKREAFESNTIPEGGFIWSSV